MLSWSSIRRQGPFLLGPQLASKTGTQRDWRSSFACFARRILVHVDPENPLDIGQSQINRPLEVHVQRPLFVDSWHKILAGPQ
jgi:hypothetical protein